MFFFKIIIILYGRRRMIEILCLPQNKADISFLFNNELIVS
jgi:hypothetical protein